MEPRDTVRTPAWRQQSPGKQSSDNGAEIPGPVTETDWIVHASSPNSLKKT